MVAAGSDGLLAGVVPDEASMKTQETPQIVKVTMREWNVLTFIRSYAFRHGYMPTQTEIARGCGLKDRKTVMYLLVDLSRKGAVTFEQTSAQKKSYRLANVRIGVAP